MTAPVTIVMAGGLGTRMRSPRPKVLHDLCGRPMLEWVVAAAREAGAEDVVVVVSPDIAAAVAAAVPGIRVAVQDRPLGTADAVRAGLAVVPNGADRGHRPVGRHADDPRRDGSRCRRGPRGPTRPRCALVTTRAAPPHAYGRVVRARTARWRGSSRRATRAPDELAVDEINVGPLLLLRGAPGRGPRRARGPQRPGRALPHRRGRRPGRGGRARVAVDEADRQSCEGVNTMIELSDREAELRRRLCDQAMLAGVRIVDPATTFLEPGVRLEPGCRIEPFTHAAGHDLGGGGRGRRPPRGGRRRHDRRWLRRRPVRPSCAPAPCWPPSAQVGRFVELKNTHLGRRVEGAAPLATSATPRSATSQHRRRHHHGQLRRGRTSTAPRSAARRPHELRLRLRRSGDNRRRCLRRVPDR